MDLSFRPLLPDRELTVLPGELAMVIARVAAQQGDSITARAQAIMDLLPVPPDRFAPVDGSFNAAVAAALARWRDE